MSERAALAPLRSTQEGPRNVPLYMNVAISVQGLGSVRSVQGAGGGLSPQKVPSSWLGEMLC